MDCLLVSAGRWTCAVPVTGVAETMRALPVRPCADVAAYVLGVSLIRGSATLVLDLARLLGGEPGPCPRLVLLRSADRPVALGVDRVSGIRALAEAELSPVRGVLSTFARGQLEALTSLDGALVALLSPTLILADEVMRQALAQGSEA